MIKMNPDGNDLESRKPYCCECRACVHDISLFAPGIIPFIMTIIKSSFTTSTFPRDWKIADFVTSLKRG